MMDPLRRTDPEVFRAICDEVERQQNNLVLIASENYVSEAALLAAGSVMTNKYAEGYPGKRYYGGCEQMDKVESLAIERAKRIFRAEHANVQPHCGSSANAAVYFACLKPGDKILSMAMTHGGHLTHGAKHNFSSVVYNCVHYGVSPKTEMLDYDEIARLAREHRPKLIIAGSSAYPRIIDFNRFAEIAREVGSLLMSDIAHIAGPIAVGLHPDAVGPSDFVTGTTHKTMRGPRGGFILCKRQYAKDVDSWVFPGLQGGPLMHVIAAKAVSFLEALAPEFKSYQQQILNNARTLADTLTSKGYRLVSGGTDNHLMVVDLTEKGMTGKLAEQALGQAGLTCNKNLIPFDKRTPAETSGIRLGTPATTTRGLKEAEMRRIGEWIDQVLRNPADESVRRSVRAGVTQMCESFPIYQNIRYLQHKLLSMEHNES